jgi:alcohol dehydrogenase (NADP+)
MRALRIHFAGRITGLNSNHHRKQRRVTAQRRSILFVLDISARHNVFCSLDAVNAYLSHPGVSLMSMKTAGRLATDAVDLALVPSRTLYTGTQMPAIGLGTFGSDHVPHQLVADTVLSAAAMGYRHFDCASVYGNENLIGISLEQLQANGLEREQLWITSKLWNDKHGEDDVIASCEQSLADLRLDYLDLFLVHWPFPNHHPPGCDVNLRNPHAVPFIHESYMRTWRKMEELVDRGLVRHIGTSNMTVPKMKLLLRDARIRPAANEMELHPHFQQPEFFEFLLLHNVQPIGYSPIGSPGRPARDRTPDDTSPTEDPVIVRIAERLGIHPAVVCIKWAVQRGHIPIPFSANPRNCLANLRGVVSEPLTSDDMSQIAAIDRNCRLIKGQVFLWKADQTWEDLWDVHGEITPA